MNRRASALLFFFASTFAIGLIACTSPEDAIENEESSEEDLTARETLQGSWKGDHQGLDLRPGREFFWDTLAKPPNPPSSAKRSEGSWHANKRSSTLTIEVDGDETVYRYVYTPARILNGFAPRGGGGGMMTAKLELTQLKPAAFAPVVLTFDKVDSWCKSPVDCQLEQQDKTWQPASPGGTPSCKRNACEPGPAGNDTVALECGPARVLNGFIDPTKVWSAEVTQHLPRILNGFAIPTYTVTVKMGNVVQAELKKCTGNVANWDLHCTPDDGMLGVGRVFELSNEAQQHGAYKTQVVAPNAPVTTHDFRCTPPN